MPAAPSREKLSKLIKTRFKTDGAREFQLSCMSAEVFKQGVLLKAATNY